MRPLSVLALLILLTAGCTPRIPAKEDFATSALVAKTEIPPEFADFNRYDPAPNVRQADQICATPYQQFDKTALGAEPGQIVAWHGRCETHVPLLGAWAASWPSAWNPNR